MKKAFTLVELLAALAVATLLTTLMLTISSKTLRFWESQIPQISSNTTALHALDTLESDLQSASPGSILITNKGQSLSLIRNNKTISYHLNNNTLLLKGSPFLTDVEKFLITPIHSPNQTTPIYKITLQLPHSPQLSRFASPIAHNTGQLGS